MYTAPLRAYLVSGASVAITLYHGSRPGCWSTRV
jgi:hypothetical protein